MSLPEPPRPRELLSEHARRFPGKPILIAFDFDGTLVPIVPRPGQVEVPTELCENLRTAAQAFFSSSSPSCRLAIVTGRALQDLTRYLPECPGLDFIGNHGLEWWIWDRMEQESCPRLAKRDLTPDHWRAWRESFLNELRAQVRQFGGEIEDKRASLTLHYRNSGTEFWQSERGRNWLEARLESKTTQLLGGKAAWNLLPAGASKGASVLRYCEEFDCAQLMFFGDEPTDETVFALQSPPVVGVKVGREGEAESAAGFGLEDVRAARHWIEELADIKLAP